MIATTINNKLSILYQTIMRNNNINSIRVSLKSLLTDYDIERIIVPIIQRDYAQGRTHEKDIRKNFLQKLLEYLSDRQQESHDLDFIYGNKNTDNEFIPLDGQQRLTTLFLLHYYLAIHDDRYSEFESVFVFKEKSRFSYETRSSATDFCNTLVTNPICKESLGNISDSLINEYAWFSEAWINDPTVRGMINMLESIHRIFNKEEGLFSRLIDENPAITFRVLFMQESGLNDDLYIKMNSRGLELSPFENLKARIISKIKNIKDKSYSLQRTKQKDAEEVSVSDYFSFKIDINWSELFWLYRKEYYQVIDSGDKYTICEIDSSLINFITTIALNYNAIHCNNITNLQMTSYNSLGWSFYEQLPIDFYVELIDAFDIFEKDAIYDEKKDSGICDRITDYTRFNIKKTFTNFIHKNYSDAAYAEHIQFYGYYYYLLKHKTQFNQSDFNNWMRIVMNLTNNHSWQNEQDFMRSMKTVKWLIDNNTNGIIELLGNNNKIQDNGFNPVQFKEERIKAAMQLRNDAKEWKYLILNAEKHEYFKGQISCIIRVCDIELYFDENNQKCDWNDEKSEIYKESFIRYTKVLEYLFDDNGLSPIYEKDQIFRRALLCYGDFGKDYGWKRWSLLRNKHRDYSWKRGLLEKENLRCLKGVLDKYDVSFDLTTYLGNILKDYTSSDDYSWRDILIRDENNNVWGEFGDDYFLCFDNNENDIYVMSSKTMGGWHSEIRTICLKNELQQQYNYNIEYHYSNSWETFPFLNVKHQSLPLQLMIKFSDNKWNLYAECLSPELISDCLIGKLESLHFTKSDNQYFHQTTDKDSLLKVIEEFLK